MAWRRLSAPSPRGDTVLRKLERYRAGGENSESSGMIWSACAGRWASYPKVEDLLERLLVESGVSVGRG
jgi:hypothetical protein